jgi:type III pantothenate kinase
MKSYWLGLTIGNSRWHWGLFADDILIKRESSQHLSSILERDRLIQSILTSYSLDILPVYLISVVPQQTKLWLSYEHLTQITLQDIPLTNLYPTLGIDRAIAALGGGETYGYPCLIVDGGTALTFTGIDNHKKLIGGAILLGLRSQFTSLHQKTAALPEVTLPDSLPNRWALDTDSAIASGIIYTYLASIQSFIADWYEQFPHSGIILTGGDSDLLWQYLQVQSSLLSSSIMLDRNLILWGIKGVYNSKRKNT